MSKATYAGLLDQMVAGGHTSLRASRSWTTCARSARRRRRCRPPYWRECGPPGWSYILRRLRESVTIPANRGQLSPFTQFFLPQTHTQGSPSTKLFLSDIVTPLLSSVGGVYSLRRISSCRRRRLAQKTPPAGWPSSLACTLFAFGDALLRICKFVDSVLSRMGMMFSSSEITPAGVAIC